MILNEHYKKCYEERVCYCGNKFYVPKKPRKGRRGVTGLRPMRSRTCSKECSKNFKNEAAKKQTIKKKEKA